MDWTTVLVAIGFGVAAVLWWQITGWQHRVAKEKIERGDTPIQRMPGPRWLKVVVIVAFVALMTWWRFADPLTS